MINLPGYFNNDDYLAITEIAKVLPESGTLVEIGSGFGKSAACWSIILKELGKDYQIYTLDSFRLTYSILVKNGTVNNLSGDMKLLRPYVMAEMNQEEITKHLLKDYSNVTVIKYDIFENNPSQLSIDNIQCVFVDANHSSVGTKKCLADWYPLISSKGIYSGHDYDWHQVQPEIDLFANEHMLAVITPNPESSVFYIQTH